MSESVAVATESPEFAGTTPEDLLRANSYGLLGSLLAATPAPSLIELLGQIEDVPEKGATPIARAWHGLRLAATRTTADAVDDEYHALFVGIARGEVMPYGSYYTTGFLMDKPLALLRRDLAALGFERQAEVKEPEDHAAALCETMSMIITHGDEITPAVQQNFFSNHVGSWMGQLFADLQQAKSARFYRAVGYLGEQFIELERSYFSMSV